MKPVVYVGGFLAIVVASLLCGRYVEGGFLAAVCAVLISFGLLGLTEQIAQAIDEE